MLERFTGCMLGLALGDALGAPYEGGPIERAVWRLIGKTRKGEFRWTDDTQMALDVGESILETNELDADHLAAKFAAGYRWSRGYGPGAAKILKRIARGRDWRDVNVSVYGDGSFGNGGAMRSPVIGLFFSRRPDELVEAARLSATVTHAHRLGIEGAVLIAAGTAAALHSEPPLRILELAARYCVTEQFLSRLERAASWLGSGETPRPDEVARQLGNGVAASESCVTALYLALRYIESSFMEMMSFVLACRGDTDTIGAMAGALWGATNGASDLPQEHLDKLEQRERITKLATALYDRVASG